MNKTRKKIAGVYGMTMAELLIVVAIISILAGVSFIAVNRYQRSLGLLERDGIAKEIFIAAQNHLTTVYGEGYLGTEIPGNKENEDDSVYYYVYNDGVNYTSDETSVLDHMLPFGSIDETVRMGGSYIVRYQKSTGRVMDVFYCSTHESPSRFNHPLVVEEYKKDVLPFVFSDDKSSRRNWKSGSILGYFGGESFKEIGKADLAAPTIEVINAETLSVKITDHTNTSEVASTDYAIKLIITGKLSGAKKGFVVKSGGDVPADAAVGSRLKTESTGTYSVILDDITSMNMHFADITSENAFPFIPGEDITVQAACYSNSLFANVAYSEEENTNSLFARTGKTSGSEVPNTAYISNIRHLENLDKTISDLDKNDTAAAPGKLNIANAVQTRNLDWKNDDKQSPSATSGFWDSKKVYPISGKSSAGGYNANYYPINPDYSLSYDGQNHSISNIVAECDNAGLFGSPTGTSTVLNIANLELIDFQIKGKDSAGALAGSLEGVSTGSSITNVIVHNSVSETSSYDSAFNSANPNVSASAGTAGGLVGNGGSCLVSYSAAAVYVKGNTAGGLIGTASGNVSGCYSGGHTLKAAGSDTEGSMYSTDNYNVVGTSAAGGLIGSSTGSKIENSYSTCSASATTTAGGFVGIVNSGTAIEHCYCTGLVSGTGDNAFVGSGSPTVSTEEGKESYYFDIINEIKLDSGEFKYKQPGCDNVKAIDEDAATYDTFVGAPGAPDQWKTARAYNKALRSYYSGKYNLKTVEQLVGSAAFNSIEGSGKFFVKAHYGDWPAPEIFVINTAS